MWNLFEACCEEAILTTERISSEFGHLNDADKSEILEITARVAPSFQTLQELCCETETPNAMKTVRSSIAFGFRSCVAFVARADDQISLGEILGISTLDDYLTQYFVPEGTPILARLNGDYSVRNILVLQKELELFHTTPAILCALIDRFSDSNVLQLFRESVFYTTMTYSSIDGSTDFEWKARRHLDDCLSSAVYLMECIAGCTAKTGNREVMSRAATPQGWLSV